MEEQKQETRSDHFNHIVCLEFIFSNPTSFHGRVKPLIAIQDPLLPNLLKRNAVLIWHEKHNNAVKEMRVKALTYRT